MRPEIATPPAAGAVRKKEEKNLFGQKGTMSERGG
jgi:hypothetical protein